MTHIRTIKEAAAYFKAEDAGTCLTETAIRTLVRSGKVASTRVGKNTLSASKHSKNIFRGKQPLRKLLCRSRILCGV